MKITKYVAILVLLGFFSLTFSACGLKKTAEFSDDSDTNEIITTLKDKNAKDPIDVTQTYNFNQEFKVKYKTFSPEGEGNVEVKAKSIREIPLVGKRTPGDGKKLVLVEIAVKGNTQNQGEPSTFNQIGDHASPQFVLLDRGHKQSLVETTYFSDGYTEDKKLFELSKITLDHNQVVNTAIVFEIDKNLAPELAFRFTNSSGKTEFYVLK